MRWPPPTQIAAGDERPFAGVPIAIKNNRAVKGMRLTYACSLAAEHVAEYDHNVTRRLRDAGFVVVGTTALPEYGIVPTTESRLLGPTRNPWDTSRTPGGSSGGSAAAVAAGMVPIAHGNDGGGSTRIPAACCGLVGLKPQRNRISSAPDLGDSFLGIDGVLTRTVHDTARALDVLAGYEPGDSNWAPPPAEPFADLRGRRSRAAAHRRLDQPPAARRAGARDRDRRRAGGRSSCSNRWATPSRRPIRPGPTPRQWRCFTLEFADRHLRPPSPGRDAWPAVSRSRGGHGGAELVRLSSGRAR